MQTMNYKEAAAFLKVSTGTLRNWVSTKRIIPRKVGKHVLFFREELEAWIKSPAPAPVQTRFNASNSQSHSQTTALQPPQTEWQPALNATFSERNEKPYCQLHNLPCKNIKMTPDNMRELARLLVDAADLCEEKKLAGFKDIPIIRTNAKHQSAVVVIPSTQMQDLKTLEQAATRAGDITRTTREKYLVQFINEGLKNRLSQLNTLLATKGKRKISFKSLK